ncbi:MAG: deoxyribose-phosphate aldolase [Acidimicrobiaceae bacterium]|nr:deoxyribose-phosphate aldolase [Acidimicrobiaceae bacterium]
MTITPRPWLTNDHEIYGAADTTAASSGKNYRLGRIFGEDGRSLVLPADHGTMLGRVKGLEDPIELVRRFLALPCDGFLLSPGIIQRTAPWFARREAPARLLTIDSYWRGPDVGLSVLSTSLARASYLGVDAVKVLMPWDVPASERAHRASFIGQIITEAEEFGLPVMVEPIVLSSPRPADAVAIEGDGCRMAAELGADIIKVAYPGDADLFGQWCDELGVPVVILGGPAEGATQPLNELVSEAMAAGAKGVTIGRRLWQRPIEEATELFAELFDIVHPTKG